MVAPCRALLLALVLATAACSNAVRPDDDGAGGAGTTSAADTSTSAVWTVGGAAGLGGAGGASNVNCEGIDPGTFVIRFDLADESYLIEDGCYRFPELPYAMFNPGGACDPVTRISGCTAEPGGDFHISTSLDAAGYDEVTGTFGTSSLLGNLYLTTFSEVGGVVSGELDGVITNDPSGDQIGFHAELTVCRLPDLTECP